MKVSRRLHGLDAMRGIAALCVFGFHLHAVYPDAPNPFGKGYLAVDFFMMLSGYVMARTYEARMHGGLDAGRFIAIRYKRLWLTMAAGNLIGVGYLWQVTGDPAWFALAFVLNIALLPAPVNGELTPLNSPGWSIFYELLANAVHGAFLWRLSNRALSGVIVALAIPFVWFCYLASDLDFGAMAAHAGGAVVRCLTAYSIGVLLFRLWQDRPPIQVPWWAAMLILAILMSTPLEAIGWQFDAAFVLLVCPLLIAGGLTLKTAPKLADWLGMLSFPLYAVHMAVFKAAHMAELQPGIASVLALSVGIALTWLLWLREDTRKSNPQKM